MSYWQINLGSYPLFYYTNRRIPIRQKCKNSGLPNFSRSQLSNSDLPGAKGEIMLSAKDLNYKVIGTLSYSQKPSPV